jgi:hypothetical protein
MIALVRMASPWMSYIDKNPALTALPKLVVGQIRDMDKPHLAVCTGKNWVVCNHQVIGEQRNRVYRELVEMFTVHEIRYVVATQKLLWYSDVLEQVCRDLKIELTWCEIFFDDRIIMDRTGLQYCKDNDIHYESTIKPAEPILPKKTRLKQPSSMPAAELLTKLKVVKSDETVVVLGQVPHDMALRQFPGLSYPEWLHAIFTHNHGTTFLFKHHPQAPTAGIEKYSNVRVINEGLDSLWGAFSLFASFSSTTIFEGMIRGKKFATGGYHFCSGLTPTVHSTAEAKGLVEKLRAHETPQEAWTRRLTFICNHYTIPLTSPNLWKRMTTTSEQYFA